MNLRLDEGSFEKEEQVVGEKAPLFGVVYERYEGSYEELAKLFFVFAYLPSEGLGKRMFPLNIQKSAATKVHAAKPFFEKRKRREGFRSRAALLRDVGIQHSKPSRVTMHKIGKSELQLGRKMRIECGLRNARRGDDLIDTCRAQPLGVEECVGGVEELRAGFVGSSSLDHRSKGLTQTDRSV